MAIKFFGSNSLTQLITLIKNKFDALATVAKTGSYNDLSDKPTIPSGGVTGVKGDFEGTYRAGNVNLTPDNIGALPKYNPRVSGTLAFGYDGHININSFPSDSENWDTFISNSGISDEEYGLNISQCYDECSGIHMDGNTMVMWSPCDSGALWYFDDDNGDIIFHIDKDGKYYDKNNTSYLPLTGGKITGGVEYSITSGKYYLGGNGSYSYCKIADITITGAYVNYPIVFEIAGRGRDLNRVTVLFNSVNNSDPTLNTFVTETNTDFYLVKTGTSAWSLYGRYNEIWGNLYVYRVYHPYVNVTVNINMQNVSSIPSGYVTPTSKFSLPGHTHSKIQDTNNSQDLTFSYSKAGLSYPSYTWLAGWNGTELRAVHKSQFATAEWTYRGYKANGTLSIAQSGVNEVLIVVTTGVPTMTFILPADAIKNRITNNPLVFGASNAYCVTLGTSGSNFTFEVRSGYTAYFYTR